jgi:chromosome segregation ATPase
MHITPEGAAALTGATGLGYVVKLTAGKLIHRNRETVDVAKLSVEITAQVMGELRTELTATRTALMRAHAKIDELSSALYKAHAETEELRAELAEARRELDALSAGGAHA